MLLHGCGGREGGGGGGGGRGANYTVPPVIQSHLLLHN